MVKYAIDRLGGGGGSGGGGYTGPGGVGYTGNHRVPWSKPDNNSTGRKVLTQGGIAVGTAAVVEVGKKVFNGDGGYRPGGCGTIPK